jgi:ubiquinone/menaquinone biosynthesis C-methylase UbiE
MQSSQEQFGRQAAFYSISAVHAQGDSLDFVRELAALTGAERVLDVATGTGFTAFALAPAAASVVASDLTVQMLREARTIATDRDLLDVVSFALAAAEALPFADAAFDVVTCRVAPHHFLDIRAAIGEWARVVRPGGRVIVADTVAPEDAAVAAFMNELELRRDPSHICDYTPSQWRAMLAGAGLTVRDERTGHTPLEFRDWVRRSGTPPEQVAALHRMLGSATAEATALLSIRPENDTFYFGWENHTFLAVKER